MKFEFLSSTRKCNTSRTNLLFLEYGTDTKLSSVVFDERDHIAVYRAQGLSLCEIGRRLKRNKGTISREVRRNKAPIYDAYGACRAQKQAKKRKHEAGQRPRLKNAVIRAYVKRHLRLGWSPEQIAGRMHQRHPSLSICVESIYRYIYDHKTRCQENFVPYLVRAHRRRLLRGHRHTHRTRILPNESQSWSVQTLSMPADNLVTGEQR